MNSRTASDSIESIPSSEAALSKIDPSTLHRPVLEQTCLDLLAPALKGPGSLLVDATLGLGGHAEAALRRFPDLEVVGIDRDPHAIELASRRLAPFGTRFRPFLGTYDQIVNAVEGAQVDGILMDLGVSSMQLDQPERGFSYAEDGPLDMRMNPDEGDSAADFLNTATPQEITRVLREGADERFAPQIARLIVKRREEQPLRTTGELAQIVRDAIPAPARRTGGNPAKRTFQAVRIQVNNELQILRDALQQALRCLRVGGRIVVESYQSLEDRIVKVTFAEGAGSIGSALPPGVPVTAVRAEQGRRLNLLTKGALKADANEQALNPRSASVRLRAAELLEPWGSDVD